MMKTRVNGTVRPEMDAGLRRGIAAAAVLLIVCVLAVGVVSADTVTVSSFDELQSNISTSGDRTIIVSASFPITSQLTIDSGNITLTTDGKDHTLSRGNSFTDNLFIVNSGGNLTITGNSTHKTNLTLDGMGRDSGSLVKVSGSFTLADGGILTNNTAYSGGGVYVYNSGTFTMSGGILTNNTAYSGGGVYMSDGSTFEMSGGEISGNTANNGYGGGVCMFDTFEMSGGEISGNEASYGGGVYMSGGTFTMSDGEISGNEASYGGGGVYMSGGSTFDMSGNAAISDNTADLSSGGVGMFGGTFTISDNAAISGNTAGEGGGVGMFGGIFTMSGGEISDNTADLSSGGVYLGSGTFTMSGNAAISGNEAGTNGGGVYVGEYSTFELSGSGSTDSVYLASGKSITVTKELTGPTPQISGIELERPGDGTTVVTGTPLQADALSYFELDSSVTEYKLEYQSQSSIVLKLRDPRPLPPSGGSSSDGNMENAFRVLFNDGATTLSVQTDLSYGDKLTKPEDPVKDGYTFAGWYKDSACTNPWDFETGIPGDMTLYAKWTAAGSSGETEATATPTATATAVTTPQPTKTQTAAATTSAPEATTAAGVSPTLTQAPAPVAGALFGLLAAGVLLRRRFQ